MVASEIMVYHSISIFMLILFNDVPVMTYLAMTFPVVIRHLRMATLGSFLIAAVFTLHGTTALAQARVVSSITPLQMIAHAITDGVSEPAVLIPSTQSYHHFVLRPSTLRVLNEADLFIWVGPELETYLSGAVSQLSNQKAVLQVLALPSLIVHHAHDAADHSEILIPGDGLHAGHQHKHGTIIDPHVWLDTRNATLIARAITRELVNIDSGFAPQYRANLERFEALLAQLDNEIAGSLHMPDEAQYAVYHNAFQYFERRYGLDHKLVFVASEEMQPGVRHMLTVRRAIEARPLLCLLEDVTTQASTVQTLLGGNELLRVKADTLGQNLSPGPMAYIYLIDNLADAFRQCFGR
jgi:zinc transport system substrate-binding protein